MDSWDSVDNDALGVHGDEQVMADAVVRSVDHGDLNGTEHSPLTLDSTSDLSLRLKTFAWDSPSDE